MVFHHGTTVGAGVHPKATQLEQVDLTEINGLGIDKTPEKEKRKKNSLHQ
jgi:hypothetical protein